MENLKRTANVLADKALLAMLASDEDAPFSKPDFQIVLDVLAKVTLPSSLDHGILRKIFERLRSWSSTQEVFSVVPLLANVYDNLLHRDLGQPDVSDCLCELLFLIEDMSDHRECKLIAGKHFLQRLLALAGSKLTGIKLQRIAVETLSSILLMSPINQKIVLEDLNSEWHKLVKQVLPHCGDFFVQASIVEIFYRLSKRSPRLLDWLEDKTLREKMISLHQTKKPDLHAETRTFLDHLNQSLGHSRSVYSFLAKDIIFDGRSTPLKDEKWLHFGLDHMSCYAALDSDAVGNNTSLVDVIYTRVCDLQVCSNNSLEITFRETPPSGQDTWIRVKTIKLTIVLKSKELEIIMDYVLPRINSLQKDSQKGGSKEINSENTTTTPSFSAKIERSFRKASVGFAIPLPRKFKLPSLPKSSNEQVDLNIKAFQDHNNGAKVAEKRSEGQISTKVNLHDQTKDEAISKTGLKDNGSANYDLAASMKSSTRIFQLPNSINQEKTTLSMAYQSEDYKLSLQAKKEPCLKQDKLSSLQDVDNCKNLSPACHFTAKTSNSTPTVQKTNDKFSSQSRKDADSNLCSNAGPSTMKVGNVSYAPRKSTRRTVSAIDRETELRRLPSSTAPAEDNDAEAASRLGNIGKTSTDDERTAVENVVQRDPVSKSKHLNTEKAAVHDDDKVVDSKQTDKLQERILNILKKANLPQSDADADDMTKQKNSTSDPIETDSEQNKSVRDNRNLAITMSKKALLKQKKITGDTCQGQEAGETPRIFKRKSVLQLEKAGKLLSKKQAPQKDVFCFEEDQQCGAAKDIEDKLFEAGDSKSKDDDHLADLRQINTAAKSTRLLETTTSKLFKGSDRKSKDDVNLAVRVQRDTVAKSTRQVGHSKSKDDDHLADLVQTDLVQTDTPANLTRCLETTPHELFKVGISTSKENNHLAHLLQTNTAANSTKLLEKIPNKLSKLGNSKNKDDADLTQTDTAANSARWLETTPKRLFRVGNYKNKDEEHLANLGQIDAASNPGRFSETLYEPFDVDNSKSKDGDHFTDLVQKDSAANSARLLETAPSNLTGFDDACAFKSVCCPKERKRELEINRSPAKRIKCSPEVAVVKSLNNGLQCSLFAREVLARFDRTESPKSGGRNTSKEEKQLHAIFSPPKETRKEQANGFTGGKRRLAVSPKSASPAKHAPLTFETRKRPNKKDQKRAGKTKKTFDALLEENVQPAESVDGDAMTDGEMQLVAALVQKIMKKIKVQTQNKSAQILSNAVEAVHQCCQAVQGQIESDLDESTKLAQETFEKLQLQLQEEQEAFLGTQQKWKDEFNKHIHRFKEISSQVDCSHSYLKSVSDKQKIEHQKIFASMSESVELHLSETEQKLIALQKGAAGHRNELKGALLQIF